MFLPNLVFYTDLACLFCHAVNKHARFKLIDRECFSRPLLLLRYNTIKLAEMCISVNINSTNGVLNCRATLKATKKKASADKLEALRSDNKLDKLIYSSSSTNVISDVLPPDAVVSILIVFSVSRRLISASALQS